MQRRKMHRDVRPTFAHAFTWITSLIMKVCCWFDDNVRVVRYQLRYRLCSRAIRCFWRSQSRSFSVDRLS